MSHTKTIGTILVSLIVGAIALLFASPKKIAKKKEVDVIKSKEDNTSQNLFI